jgi:hypothetical protein
MDDYDNQSPARRLQQKYMEDGYSREGARLKAAREAEAQTSTLTDAEIVRLIESKIADAVLGVGEGVGKITLEERERTDKEIEKKFREVQIETEIVHRPLRRLLQAALEKAFAPGEAAKSNIATIRKNKDVA